MEPATERRSLQSNSSEEETNENKASEFFDCNICLDTVSSPVVTLCGHLYCWPCLYQWLATRSDCPVCKAGVSVDNVIPVYGRGVEAVDPRSQSPQTATVGQEVHSTDSIPSRPRGQRPDAELLQRRRRFQNMPFGHLFQSANHVNHATNNNNIINNNNTFMSPTMNFFSILLSGAAPFRPADPSSGAGGVATAPLNPRDAQQQMQQAFLSRMLLIVGALVLLSLLAT